MDANTTLNYTDFFRWTVTETGDPEILNDNFAMEEILIDYMGIHSLSGSFRDREQGRFRRFLQSGANRQLSQIGRGPDGLQKEQYEQVIARLQDIEDLSEALAREICGGFWRAYFHIEPPASSEAQYISDFDIRDNVLVKYNGSADHVVIPEGVVHISKEAFANNHTVKYVTIPNSVYGLNKDVFVNCVNLREIIIPGNVATVRLDWFAGCVSLERLVLQPGVQKLHFGTKLGQLYVKRIEIPDSLTYMSWITVDGQDHMAERLKHPKIIVASDWWIQNNLDFFQKNPDFYHPGQVSRPPEPVTYNPNTQHVQPVSEPRKYQKLLTLGNLCAIGNGILTLWVLFTALFEKDYGLAIIVGSIPLIFTLSVLRKNYLLAHGLKEFSFSSGIAKAFYSIWRFLEGWGGVALVCWILMVPDFIMTTEVDLRMVACIILWSATLVYHVWHFIAKRR